MSVSKLARQRGKILDEIMRHHREQLPKTMRQTPLADLQAFATLAPPALSLRQALARPGVNLIAECKKASPSRGLLSADYDAADLAQTYVAAGAAAISVLTDARHFQGSLADLRDVKEAVPNAPVLRKDFIFHPYQVVEARAAGADAVLLIATVLASGELKELLSLVNELGMEALVEVHTEDELEQALPLQPTVLGINNRNLQTFQVDFANTTRLRRLIPGDVIVVGESGIKTAADIGAMAAAGVDAVLVGETLVKSKDVLGTTRALVAAGQPPLPATS